MDDLKDLIATALRAIQARIPDAAKARSFYDGTQEDAYDQAVWQSHFGKHTPQPRDNMCPLVVDTVVNRLTPLKFVSRTDDGGDGTHDDGENTPEAVQANRLAKQVRFEQIAPVVHREGGKVGRAAVLVGVNSKGKAVLYPQDGDAVHFEYDPEAPDQVLWAAKYWTIGQRSRLNLYFADRTVRLVTETDRPLTELALQDQAAAFVPFRGDDAGPVVENHMGRVPLFEFALDKSDLTPVYRLQPVLDLALCDLTILSHTAGHPQKWIAGAVLDQADPSLGEVTLTNQTQENYIGGIPTPASAAADLQQGPTKTWVMEDAQARAGSLAQADLEGSLKLLDNTRMAILRDTSIPPHFALMHSGHFPSGKALRTAESQFVAKVMERRMAWGNVWEDVFAFAVQAENSHNANGTFRSLAAEPTFELVWDSPFTEEGLSPEDALIGLVNLGVPMSVVLRDHYGYGPDQAKEIEELAERLQTKKDDRDQLRGNAFNRGRPDGGGFGS